MARIRWRVKGFEEIRRLESTDALLMDYVDKVLDSVGRGDDYGYDGGVSDGKSRSRGYVVAYTARSQRENASNHTLLNALISNRGL